MVSKKIVFRFLFLAVFFLISACSNSANVGTIVNRPAPPTQNLFPDFDENFPETALDASASDAEALVRGLVGSSQSTTPLFVTALEASGVPDLWDALFVNGGIEDIRQTRSELSSFGETLASLIAAQGITEITDTAQTVMSSELSFLNDMTATWEIEMALDSTDEDYIRMYFFNSSTGLLQANYVVDTDSDGNVEKGIFTYIEPSLLSDSATSGTRLFSFAFDVTNTERNLWIARVEKYDSSLGRFITFQTHQQCNVVTQGCLGEYEEITTEAPTRELSERGIRFAWSEVDRKVCLSDIDGSTGTIEILSTFGFQGPETPDVEDVTADSCAIGVEDVVWNGATSYSANYLPQRYEDTEPHGGLASHYYQDGISKTGWDALTPDLIDTWLDASLF